MGGQLGQLSHEQKVSIFGKNLKALGKDQAKTVACSQVRNVACGAVVDIVCRHSAAKTVDDCKDSVETALGSNQAAAALIDSLHDSEPVVEPNRRLRALEANGSVESSVRVTASDSTTAAAVATSANGVGQVTVTTLDSGNGNSPTPAPTPGAAVPTPTPKSDNNIEVATGSSSRREFSSFVALMIGALTLRLLKW